MGNQQTTSISNIESKENKDVFSNVLENIAEKYILNQNFSDLLKLNDPHYCDKIVVLTAELLNENLNTHEIEYLSQRTKSGIDINEKIKQTITFAPKQQFDTINTLLKPTHKKRLCIGIARFFIKVAQLYSAIFMTLNPTYSYTDAYGIEHALSASEKHKLPPGVTTRKTHLNICNARLDYLTKHSSIPSDNNADNSMSVHPDFCSVGIDSQGRQQSLIDQIGIKELERLYYDIYDFDTGKFNKMSDTMKKQYDDDIRTLYAAFTDKDPATMPPTITSFVDIKMKTYNILPSCSKKNTPYNIKHYGTLGDPLFKDYATHIRTMKATIESNQQTLLNVLKQLFISVIHSETGSKTFSVHPDLTIDSLNIATTNTIKTLVNQYITCEKDYLKGLHIYEAIVENKIKKLTEQQIKELELQVQQSIDTIHL